MKKIPTLFLQAVVILIAIGVLAFMIFEPQIEGRNVHATLFQIYFNDPFLMYAYAASIPFFVALHHVFKILGFARKNTALISAKEFRIIKRCALSFIAFISAPLAYLWIVRPGDDIAGGVAMCLALIFISTVVAAIAAIFEHLLEDGTRQKLTLTKPAKSA